MKSTKLLCLFLTFVIILPFILGTTNLITANNRFYSFSDSYIENKLGYNLQTLLHTRQNDGSLLVQVIIIFENKTAMEFGKTQILTLSPKIQLIREWQFIPCAVFKTPLIYIEELVQFPEIKSIWLDQKFRISSLFGNQPDIVPISENLFPNNEFKLDIKDSVDYNELYNGTNVIVALLDTGVDIFHPDLNESILAFGGVSMVEGDPFPLDFHGHGTFCAGIITGDGVLNSTYKGVASGADILNIKVLSYLGIGLWSWIISGIEYAITHGADIISMCFSMPGYPGDPVNLAIDTAVKRGMIIVTAVGDDGPSFSSISAPGMAQSAITVGAFNDFTGKPASFSGRGPSLSFHTKPDLLASGVNITSCRPSIPSNLPINLTDFFTETISYGLPLNDDYTTVNSTSASAAIVTGVVASLLQHSKFLSAEEVKIILQTTADPLSNIPPNIQGTGLINPTKAHLYLDQLGLNASLRENRLYTPSLFSPGYVTSQNASRTLTAFVTDYGSCLAIIESSQNDTFTHLIQGQLAIKYNNNLKWLSEMYLLRELHNLTSEFSVIQSVITDYSVICIFSVEAWPSINAFRINLTLINLEQTPLHNLTIFSLWETDLFMNQSAQNSNDTCEYNSIDDIIYAYDSKNGNTSYIGFTGINPSIAYEINTSSIIRNHIQEDSLQKNDTSLKNMSIAMEWNLTSILNSSKFIRFSQYIGIGNSYSAINQSINSIKSIQSFENMTNLAILSSNLSRIGSLNQPYTSNVLVINLGNIPVNDTLTAFLVNSTDEPVATFFSKYIDLGKLDPYEFRWVNASWNPTEVDIYSAYWIVGTKSLINEIILYLVGFTQEISTDQNFFDNFYARNIFIKDNLIKLHNIFPNYIPTPPQLIYYPGDIAIFNISITTNHYLTDLQITMLEGNIPSDWISINNPSTIQNFGSIQITLSISQNPPIGLFYQKLNISTNDFHIGEIWINFSVQYPSGRILFYKPAKNISFETTYQIDDLLTLWTERLDTVYGSYFDFYNLCITNNYDVDDFGVLKQFYPNFSLATVISLPFQLPYQTSTLKENTTFISNYDLVIICDPEVNLSNEEINTLIEFGQNGGSLFFWIEPEIECVQSSLNLILNSFGIKINDSIDLITTQNFTAPNQHEITLNLTKINLYSFVTFQNYTKTTIFTSYNGSPTFILNDEQGKVLCIGDSSLFNASCISEMDNFRLLNNSINWLLNEKINISVFIHNNSEYLYANQHLSLSIHLTSKNGTDLFENLTLFTYLITPSNRCLYMIFFRVQSGWYNTLYLGEWLNETGPYLLVIYANSPSKVTTYYVQELIFNEPIPPIDGDTDINQRWATRRQIFLGVIIALVITSVILLIFLVQRRQWRRQMTIVELKEKLKRDISNLLSEYHLYVKEIEDLLQKPKIREPDKLRMILDKQERKKELLKKLRKLGKNV